jgi:hypothetical protein
MKRIPLLAIILFFAQAIDAQWGTNGNDIYNTNTGNVGIGTTTPATKLDVKGTVSASGFKLYNNWDNVLSSYDSIWNYQLIGTYRGWDTRGVYIAGYNAGNAAASGTNMATERIYLGNPTFNSNYLSVNLLTGNVGIGTTAPGSFRLAVEGKIGAREVRVTSTSPWPDYVFSRHYQLPSLAAVEDYIKKNSHLPEMPSAQEVNNNGIELGQMDAKLLQKIEELTLYVIDLKKEITELKKENAQLRAMIEEKK